jgi:type I restriction enzyme S subunit
LQTRSIAPAAEESGAVEGWALVKLSEICTINPPKPPSDALPPDTPVTFAPMPAVDAEQGTIANPTTRPFAEVRRGFTAFRDGDVIMAKITPCMENGKAAIARNLRNGLGFGSTEFHVLRSNGAVEPEYLFHFVRQESFRRAAEAEMTGSVGQKRVPVSFLEEAELPLPPLAEQKRIVAKVEELLARVNAARERIARVPAILKRIRQSVLAAACSGRLTADWRENKGTLESSDRRLLRVEEPTETSQNFPDNWIWSPVETVCSAIVDCPHSTPKWTMEGLVCLRTTNFHPGYLDLNDVRFVSEETYRQRTVRLRPRAGDVLYSREGGILGIACLMPTGIRACLGQRMMLMRPGPSMLPAFLMHVLNSPLTIRRVQGLTGGTASPHLNVTEIKQFPVPVPPSQEQEEVVRRVEELFSATDKIQQRVTVAVRAVETLRQAIMAKAFRGELVPTEAELARAEGRLYESAFALLVRTRAKPSSGTVSRG